MSCLSTFVSSTPIQKPILMKKYLLVLLTLTMACEHPPVSEKETPSVVQAQMKQEVPTPEKKYSLMERELDYLLTFWPGEYDNAEQLFFDETVGKTEVKQGRHLRMHSYVELISLPAFGPSAIYLEEYRNDNPAEVNRQCLYVLSPDDKAKAIRIKVFHFREPRAQLATGKDFGFLDKLTPNSQSLRAGCELLLHREGMAFVGEVVEGSCPGNLGESESEAAYQLRIAKDRYEFRSGASSWYLLEKARCFACMIDFPREKGGRPVETKHYIKIHDQGGKFEFDYTDGRKMVLGMRNTWSFGMQRETFVIFIQEGSQKGPTLIYSWGEPGADRIGFNPGWIRVQCDLDTPRNVLLQERLRPDS